MYYASLLLAIAVRCATVRDVDDYDFLPNTMFFIRPGRFRVVLANHLMILTETQDATVNPTRKTCQDMGHMSRF